MRATQFYAFCVFQNYVPKANDSPALKDLSKFMDNVNLDVRRSNGEKKKTNRIFLTPIRGNKNGQRPKQVQRQMDQCTARTPAQVLAANARVVPFGDLTEIGSTSGNKDPERFTKVNIASAAKSNTEAQAPPVGNYVSPTPAKDEIDNVGLHVDNDFTPAHKLAKDVQVQPVDITTAKTVIAEIKAEITGGAPLASVEKETNVRRINILTAASGKDAQVPSVNIGPAKAAPASNSTTAAVDLQSSNTIPPLPPPSTSPEKSSDKSSSPPSRNPCAVPGDEQTRQSEMSPEIAKKPKVFPYC